MTIIKWLKWRLKRRQIPVIPEGQPGYIIAKLLADKKGWNDSIKSIKKGK